MDTYTLALEYNSFSRSPTSIKLTLPSGTAQVYVPEVIEPEPCFHVGNKVRVVSNKLRSGIAIHHLIIGDKGKVTSVTKCYTYDKVTVDFGTHKWTLDGELERLEHIA
jgi:hypothetical protein